MSALTTHILDTSLGRPAANVSVLLYKLEHAQKQLITQTQTNSDGRTNQPLLSGHAFEVGTYELVFEMAPYFANHYANLPNPMFLQDIPIRFSIAEPNSHYHVPLLVSPFGFSTYRGS